VYCSSSCRNQGSLPPKTQRFCQRRAHSPIADIERICRNRPGNASPGTACIVQIVRLRPFLIGCFGHVHDTIISSRAHLIMLHGYEPFLRVLASIAGYVDGTLLTILSSPGIQECPQPLICTPRLKYYSLRYMHANKAAALDLHITEEREEAMSQITHRHRLPIT